MNDRVNDMSPTKPGWYGMVSGDGEREVWCGEAYWNGAAWDRNTKLAYVRSADPFNTQNEASNWAMSQPD